jgi:hypothetical protein
MNTMEAIIILEIYKFRREYNFFILKIEAMVNGYPESQQAATSFNC